MTTFLRNADIWVLFSQHRNNSRRHISILRLSPAFSSRSLLISGNLMINHMVCPSSWGNAASALTHPTWSQCIFNEYPKIAQCHLWMNKKSGGSETFCHLSLFSSISRFYHIHQHSLQCKKYWTIWLSKHLGVVVLAQGKRGVFARSVVKRKAFDIWQVHLQLMTQLLDRECEEK